MRSLWQASAWEVHGDREICVDMSSVILGGLTARACPRAAGVEREHIDDPGRVGSASGVLARAVTLATQKSKTKSNNSVCIAAMSAALPT